MSNGNGVKEVDHIDGILYKVPLELVKFADNPEDEEEFVNPRHARGTTDPKGLSKQPFEELKTSIQKNGLQNNIILHGKGNLGSSLLTINSGERRFRAIQQLVAEDAECFDPVTRRTVKASELYSKIPANIHVDISTQEQYRLAFTNNETACDIGEGATITLVKRWRNLGWTDAEILDVTGKSQSWLRDTDSLLGLDEDTLNALLEEKINRTVAIRLSLVTDVDARRKQLAEVQRVAAERLTNLLYEVTQSLDATIEQQSLAEAQKADAEHTNNEKLKKVATKKIKKIKAKVEKQEAVLKEIKTKKAVGTSKDLEKVTIKETGESSKFLTHSKIQKHWIPQLDRLIKSEGKDETDTVVCNINDAILLKHIIVNGIAKNEYDVESLLKSHFENSGELVESGVGSDDQDFDEDVLD